MNCKRIEFKDAQQKPVLGILLKEDDHYIYFKTRKGEYRFSHDSIKTIEDTNIEYIESEANWNEKQTRSINT